MCRNMKRIKFWPLNTLENGKRCLNALYVRRWLQQQYDDRLLQRQTAVQESGFTALCSLLAAPPPREAVRSPLSLSVNHQQFLNPWWWIWGLPRPIHVYDFIQPWIFDKVRPINIWLMCSEHNQIDGLDWPWWLVWLCMNQGTVCGGVWPDLRCVLSSPLSVICATPSTLICHYFYLTMQI